MRQNRNKKIAALAAISLTAAIFTVSCGKKVMAGAWDAAENGVYVTKAMGVESAMVYTSEKANELYSQEGLAAFAKERVSEYNAEQGAAASAENAEGSAKLPVAFKECILEDQQGTLVFEYGTPADYVKFSQEIGDNTHSIQSIAVNRVSEAADQLAEFTFVTPNGEAADAGTVTNSGDCVVVLVEGAGTVYTEGKIAYLSGGDAAVTLKSSYAVMTGEGKSCIIFK